ncbi:hypothetical protein Q1695_012855 [Nippostrongylus brasiliensis]|nr:hypothetical protein Q1695_012855 [Nippostrongylus brasiliensis]
MLACRSGLLFIRTFTAKQLVYSAYGAPTQVLKLEQVELPDDPPPGQVHVKWLAAPINPADLNTLEGVYPVKPPLPAVPGLEGYGRVEKIGNRVKQFRVGDHVIPAKADMGTWRTDGYHDEADLVAIDNSLSMEASATLLINPPTAYRMLKDFVDLKPGDTIIQNGANSAVGRAVIQRLIRIGNLSNTFHICRLLGVCTINVVRDRKNLNDLIDELKQLGATEVITEEQLSKEYRGKLRNLPLALNCVGGKSALLLASTLGFRGCMVTYGGMSKKPIQAPTGPFIFKDIRLAGFWITPWFDDVKNAEERKRMFAELSGWMKSGKFIPPPLEKRNIEDFASAIEAAVKFGKKQLFVL